MIKTDGETKSVGAEYHGTHTQDFQRQSFLRASLGGQCYRGFHMLIMQYAGQRFWYVHDDACRQEDSLNRWRDRCWRGASD